MDEYEPEDLAFATQSDFELQKRSTAMSREARTLTQRRSVHLNTPQGVLARQKEYILEMIKEKAKAVKAAHDKKIKSLDAVTKRKKKTSEERTKRKKDGLFQVQLHMATLESLSYVHNARACDHKCDEGCHNGHTDDHDCDDECACGHDCDVQWICTSCGLNFDCAKLHLTVAPEGWFELGWKQCSKKNCATFWCPSCYNLRGRILEMKHIKDVHTTSALMPKWKAAHTKKINSTRVKVVTALDKHLLNDDDSDRDDELEEKLQYNPLPNLPAPHEHAADLLTNKAFIDFSTQFLDVMYCEFTLNQLQVIREADKELHNRLQQHIANHPRLKSLHRHSYVWGYVTSNASRMFAWKVTTPHTHRHTPGHTHTRARTQVMQGIIRIDTVLPTKPELHCFLRDRTYFKVYICPTHAHAHTHTHPHIYAHTHIYI